MFECKYALLSKIWLHDAAHQPLYSVQQLYLVAPKVISQGLQNQAAPPGGSVFRKVSPTQIGFFPKQNMKIYCQNFTADEKPETSIIALKIM